MEQTSFLGSEYICESRNLHPNMTMTPEREGSQHKLANDYADKINVNM